MLVPMATSTLVNRITSYYCQRGSEYERLSATDRRDRKTEEEEARQEQATRLEEERERRRRMDDGQPGRSQ